MKHLFKQMTDQINSASEVHKKESVREQITKVRDIANRLLDCEEAIEKNNYDRKEYNTWFIN